MSDISNTNLPFTCRECKMLLDINSNLWIHECFNVLDDIDYAIVSDEKNNIFSILKSELNQPVTQESTPASTTSTKDSTSARDKTDESIIIAVQKRPALYDNKRIPVKERTRLKKASLWLDVSIELKLNVEDIKSRWEYLRNRYMKTRSLALAYKPSGSAAKSPKDPSTSFQFYKIMQFLNDSTDPVDTTSSLPSAPPQLESENQDTVQESNFYKKAKRSKKNEDTFGNKVIDILKENNKPLDMVDGFLIQVGECMRMIPQQQRLQIQIQILNLLNHKIEESKEEKFNE